MLAHRDCAERCSELLFLEQWASLGPIIPHQCCLESVEENQLVNLGLLSLPAHSMFLASAPSVGLLQIRKGDLDSAHSKVKLVTCALQDLV